MITLRLAALSSAFCYALASVFFRRLAKSQPIGVTILKSIIARSVHWTGTCSIGDVDVFLSGDT